MDLEDDVGSTVCRAPASATAGRGRARHIWDCSASMLDELHRIETFRPIDIVQGPNWDSEGSPPFSKADSPLWSGCTRRCRPC